MLYGTFNICELYVQKKRILKSRCYLGGEITSKLFIVFDFV